MEHFDIGYPHSNAKRVIKSVVVVGAIPARIYEG